MAPHAKQCRCARDGLSLFALRPRHKAGVRLATSVPRLAEKFGRVR